MSSTALNWAKKVKTGSASSKSVLVNLADYADEKGSCFPSQETIAEQTELSVRAVRDAPNRLEEGALSSAAGIGFRTDTSEFAGTICKSTVVALEPRKNHRQMLPVDTTTGK